LAESGSRYRSKVDFRTSPNGIRRLLDARKLSGLRARKLARAPQPDVVEEPVACALRKQFFASAA
jgi:hypothetical protein